MTPLVVRCAALWTAMTGTNGAVGSSWVLVTLVDTEAAAFMLGISPNAVRIFAGRYPNRLPRRGTDEHGRTLYGITGQYAR